MLGNRVDSKTGRLDIRVKFNNGEDCNIELQVLPYKFMTERMLEYWAGMLRDTHNFKKQAAKEGREEGKIEGEKKAKIEVAKRMKNKKMSIDEIAELTGLARDEIEKL